MHCLIHYLNCYYIYLISAMCSIFCWIYYRVVVKINLYQCQCQYVCITAPKKYRSAYAKFRCGVAPIKIKTCRYGINRIPVNERICESCESVEDEYIPCANAVSKI